MNTTTATTTSGLCTEFLVRKDQLQQAEVRSVPADPLADGQVRVAIEHFALTSNNITYAAFGDAMNYWSFFPAEGGWGKIPVWGFGRISESRHPDLPVGERLYGYFPMASHVVLQPARVSPAAFMDGAAQRASLHPVYNQYTRCAADPFYTADSEAVQALLRPLFITSWLIDDFLVDNQFFGATDVPGVPGVMLLSSASSKTAYGNAFQLAQRSGIRVVGLTSPANRAFCESLGCYHQVLAYDELDRLAADAPAIYIDFAGNAGLRRAIHTRFTNLKYSCSIGGTHVAQLGGAKDLPGPRATLFFAPAQIKKRSAEWGPQGLNQRLLQAWQAFTARVTDPAAPWLSLAWHRGPAAVEAAYADILAGRSDPRLGHMLSMA